MPRGTLPACSPSESSTIAGALTAGASASGVTRAIAGVLPASVSHRLPSGPAAIEPGALPWFRPAELGDRALRGDHADRGFGAIVGEPQVAFGPGRDAGGTSADGKPYPEQFDFGFFDAGTRDDPDDARFGAVVGEPQIAFGPERDLGRLAAGGELVLGDDRGRFANLDRPDRGFRFAVVGEPEARSGAPRDESRPGPHVQPCRYRYERPAGVSPIDRRCRHVGEPDVSVGAGRVRAGFDSDRLLIEGDRSGAFAPGARTCQQKTEQHDERRRPPSRERSRRDPHPSL